MSSLTVLPLAMAADRLQDPWDHGGQKQIGCRHSIDAGTVSSAGPPLLHRSHYSGRAPRWLTRRPVASASS